MATIAKSSTLPHDTAPRVTSPAAVEGSMQQTINELTALCTSLVKILKDNQGVIGARSADDAPLKGRRIDEEEGITGRVSSDTKEIRIQEGEVAVERTSEDTEEMAIVLTSMDAATVLAGGIDIPTGSYFIPTAGPPVVDIHTSSDAVPTASPIVATATVVNPYSRRKGKEVMVESDTPKKQRLKRKGFNLEQEKAKKQKTSIEVPDKEKSPEEIPKEKVKEMMQLVPIKEVYVQALQVKNPIIDWKVHIKGQRSYWKIIRLGGSLACYQFFVDLLKHLDREDLNQLWVLVKEYLSIRPASSDKEIELWVELKRLYEPDPEDQLWTQTHNYMHAPIEWKLYDLSGVHHVTAKDKEIFMLACSFMLCDLLSLSFCHCLLTLSFRLRSLNLYPFVLIVFCHLAILCLDHHANTLHHLESLLTISLDSISSFVQSSEQAKSPRHYVQHVKEPILDASLKPTNPKSNRSSKRKNRKTGFVCRSVDHLIKDCDYHAKKKVQPTPRDYAHMGYNKQHASFTHKHPLKHMVPAAVLTQSKPVSITAVRPVCAAVPKIMVTRPRHAHSIVIKSK
nr:hypothetical protein [Tanacetum cinerariifolium]